MSPKATSSSRKNPFQNRQSYNERNPYANLIYQSDFLSVAQQQKLLAEILSYHPIWENRFCSTNPPPEGQSQRRLLRPVYWLGNWQFACLDYYRPPKGLENRCLQAEPYPPLMGRIVSQIEQLVKDKFNPKDVPRNWHLNTCLINYYGNSLQDGKVTDQARVGEHKDFEPGPVASLSFGERALFQFVRSKGTQATSEVVMQQWLENGSLQIFGGDKFKKQLFHRVQRVESKLKSTFSVPDLQDFETRRINLTFRYVPVEHVQKFQHFPKEIQKDLKDYVQQLAQHSKFFEAIVNQSLRTDS